MEDIVIAIAFPVLALIAGIIVGFAAGTAKPGKRARAQWSHDNP